MQAVKTAAVSAVFTCSTSLFFDRIPLRVRVKASLPSALADGQKALP